MTLLERIGDRLTYPGRHRRRCWASDERLHIELRGLDEPHRAEVTAAVERALRAVPGVSWALVDPVVGRVVVAAGPAPALRRAIFDAIEEAEESCGVEDCRFRVDAGEYPGDVEPVVRHSVALAADIAGLGFGIVGRVLRATPLPVEIGSAVSLVDNEPRLRHALESYLGTPVTDLGLAVTNAVGQSLSQGPLGLVADGTHRVNLLLEAVGRRQAFVRAEERRWAPGPPTAFSTEDEPLPVCPARPVRLPGGPVERYADRAALAGTGAAVATMAATRSGRRAAAVLLSAVPKAARLGREAFAAHLDRTLCDRDLLVLDHNALRRLDRVDTFVIDAGLLTTGRSAVSTLRLVGDDDALTVHKHLSALFDPVEPGRARRRAGWSLGPPAPAERRRVDVRAALRGVRGDDVLILRQAERAVAVVGLVEESDPTAIGLLRQARRQSLMVVVAGAPLPPGVDADLCVPGAGALAAEVRQLQADGCVVALAAPGGSAAVGALQAADVGIELPSLDGAAWSGDVLVNDVGDVAFLLDAIASAHEVSRQGVALAITGSGIGSLVGLTGRPLFAAGRASTAVNVAALAGIGNGIRAGRFLRQQGGPKLSPPARWHEMSSDDTLRALATRRDGLDGREARRRAEDTSDVRAPRPSLARSVASELVNPLTPVLAGGAVASAAIGSVADAGIVATVSGLSALIGGVQRYGAERAIAGLSVRTQTSVSVLRSGRCTAEASDSLVPGDIIVLRAGDAVPADCRIISSQQLEVDESSLTGESKTVEKSSDPIFTAVVAERSSMLYEGTTIAAGETTAVVVAVGTATVANDILSDLPTTAARAGVEARLRSLTARTLPLAGGAGAAVIGLGVLHGRSVQQSVGSAVALAVAAVPEGLPLLATMAQLASARRLSGRNALVRNPRAIEAIGRLRVLCTDKTGTLTEGRMQLRGVSDGSTQVERDHFDDRISAIVAAGLRASPCIDPGEMAPHLTDRAVIEGAARAGVTRATAAHGWSPVADLPFEPARSYHAVLGTTTAGPLLSIKGAPEVVLPRCAAWRRPSSTTPLGPSSRARLGQEVDRMGRQGMRILAVAERLRPEVAKRPGLDELEDGDVSDLTLLGFLILSDPVRPTAAGAVRDLRAAGVEVIMVTGDHPSTAEGIAVELDILKDGLVITGGQMAAMSDAELNAVIADVSVFARVTPADKVRVVQALQHRGDTVAMTGDGANDAPAIRLADVGIAMGDHATAAARRAADLIVTDERIETIVDAIIEGRAMWASLREALAILLGGNLGEIAFTVGATALTGAAPLSARQLLVVNLMTDVVPALAIALRPPRTGSPEALLAEGPDASLGASLERAIGVRATATALGAGTAWAAARLTGRRRRAGTTALVALVGSQLGQTVTIAGGDPLVLAAAAGSAAVLVAIVQTPGVSQFFGCTPLGPVAWSLALGGSTVGTASALVGPALWHKISDRLPYPEPADPEPPDPKPPESEPADPGVGEPDRASRCNAELAGVHPTE